MSQSESASQKPLLCTPGALTWITLPFLELFVNVSIQYVLFCFWLLSPTLCWWHSSLQLCVLVPHFFLVAVEFHCVKNHPLFICSAVAWPRLGFRGDLKPSVPERRSKGRCPPTTPLPPASYWVLSRFPSTNPMPVSCCFPRTWFVQKLREVAAITTISRRIP